MTSTLRDRGTERFEIKRRLGVGGMGVVYEAFDRERRTSVALKKLSSLDPGLLYRFKREFRAFADVVHENLVQLYELVSEGGQWFFSMELVDGATDFVSWVWRDASPIGDASGFWTKHSQLGPTSPIEPTEPLFPAANADRQVVAPPSTRSPDLDRLRDGLRQLIRGLIAVHHAGFLHRDVKPSNVLVTHSDRVVLCDFGIVANFGECERNGFIIGTPAYMAPEQAAGEAALPAADWYSTGVMLFEALTGRLPFTGSSKEMLELKQQQDCPRASEFASVPDDLDELCAQLLARKPGERIDGAQALRLLSRRSPEHALQEEPVLRPLSGERFFVGREAQLAEIENAHRARRPAFVRGRSGMGKTALVRQFLNQLGEGTLVLSGRCYERESVPYKAFDSVIDALSRSLLERTDVGSLLPNGAAVLTRLFPVLQRVDAISLAPRPSHEISDPIHLRAQAFAAMRGLFTNLARERPIVLFVDDFQWGDNDSAALLGELLTPDATGRRPIFAVVSYRSEDEESPLLAGLRLRIGGPVTNVDVCPLSVVESRKLAMSVLGSSNADRLVDSVVREGAGSPLFVAELAHRARDGTAAQEGVRFDDLLRERVFELEPPARKLLELACVADRALRLDIAESAVDLAPTEGLSAWRALRSAHLVRTTGMRLTDTIEPYHDRIRESLVGAMNQERLRDTHALLVQALLHHGEHNPEALFVHFRGAGDTSNARVQAELAARKSVQALAFDRAAEFYRVAIELEPALERAQPLRVAQADALVLAGRGAPAAETYLSALEGASEADRQKLRRRAAEQLLCSGRIDQGTQLLEQVLQEVGVRLARTPQRALLTLLLLRFVIFIRGLRFEPRSESQISIRDLTRIDTCSSVALGLGLVDVIQGAAFQARALLFAVRAGEPLRVARALAYEAGFLGGQGGKSYNRAKVVLSRAAALVDPNSHGDTAAAVAGSSGMIEYFSGNWADAQARFERAVSLHDCTTPSGRWELDTAEYYGICALVYQGKMREVAARLPVCRRNAEDRGDLYFACNLCVGETNLAWLAKDDPAGARAVVQEMMAGWSKRAFHAQHWFELQALSLIDLYEGNALSAANRIEATWPALAGSMILQIQVGLAMGWYLRGLSAIGTGNERRAVRAARSLHRQKMPWIEGLALILDYGIARLRAQDGTKLLVAAERQLTLSGMQSFAAAANFRVGHLLSDAARLDHALHYFAREGIQAPEKWTRMLVPE